MSKFFISGLFVCAFLLLAHGVSAHSGEDHSKETSATPLSITIPPGELSAFDKARLENIITLLRQLILTMTQLQKLSQGAEVVAAQPTVPTTSAVPHDDEEMDEHMDEHHEDGGDTSGAKLVIEIEPHFGKTHVHVRYTDKPEEMFFVDTAIDNEDGIVSEIAAHTGLAADVVKAALKYMQ